MGSGGESCVHLVITLILDSLTVCWGEWGESNPWGGGGERGVVGMGWD